MRRYTACIVCKHTRGHKGTSKMNTQCTDLFAFAAWDPVSYAPPDNKRAAEFLPWCVRARTRTISPDPEPCFVYMQILTYTDILPFRNFKTQPYCSPTPPQTSVLAANRQGAEKNCWCMFGIVPRRQLLHGSAWPDPGVGCVKRR